MNKKHLQKAHMHLTRTISIFIVEVLQSIDRNIA